MTPAYRRHAWTAGIGLALFLCCYLGLTALLVSATINAFRLASAAGKGGFVGYLAGAAVGLIAVFLLKGLLGIRRGGLERGVELRADDEPLLFDFLHRLADEIGAPRPHRVFIAPEVNAAVFYDLSLVNLIVPSKKNLVLGLGAVNSLTLSELKAVLAHELGHFAQRSMAVGRWVYIAQQVAAQLVFRRDALDRALLWLSRFHIALIFVFGTLRLIVWSIRAVIDTLFGVVVAAERALSREMELQADLVSVSIAGSDALVHALHRLSGADAGWERTLEVLEQVQLRGGAVEDAYAVQNEVLRRLRRILDEPTLGASPQLPAEGREAFRVFDVELAQPPRMWLTHPPAREREDNAKRRYVAVELDDRSAWCLFQDAEGLKRAMTGALVHCLNPDGQVPPISPELTQQVIVEEYGHLALSPRFQGVYLQEPAVCAVARARDLLDAAVSAEQLPEALATLYPPSLRQDGERHDELTRERAMLEAFRDGHLEAPGGVVAYRGRSLKRGAVGPVLSVLERELHTVRGRIVEQQRRCRSTHLALARRVGRGWPEYLTGLLELMHYTCHASNDLHDAFGHWNNALTVAFADGKLSSAERKQLVKAGLELHNSLRQIHGARLSVSLPSRISEQLGVDSWHLGLGEPYEHPAPTEENLPTFLSTAGAHAAHALSALGMARRAALIELLTGEEYLAREHQRGGELRAAPGTVSVPGQYPVLLRGQERAVQTKLSFKDRFLAGFGFWPRLLRFCLASLVVLYLVSATLMQHEVRVYVYNGLRTRVTVALGEKELQLGPSQSAVVRVAANSALPIRARTARQPIESLQVDAENYLADYVYNVAAAVPLAERDVFYGSFAGKETAPRWRLESWFQTDVDYAFSPPPAELSTKSKSARKAALSAPPAAKDPREWIELVPPARRAAVIAAHQRFDDPRDAQQEAWRSLAGARGVTAP
jgi:Zn-dependent protease with chaperone function